MAKNKVECGCGGSFDDSPSGMKRHFQSGKHTAFIAGEQHKARETAYAANGGRIGGEDDELVGELLITNLPDPYAMSPEMEKAYEQKRLISTAKDSELKLLKHNEAGLRWRIKHSPQLVRKYEIKVEESKGRIEELDAQLLAASAELEYFQKERHSAVLAYWGKVEAAVYERFSVPNDMYLRNRGEASFELALATGKILTNAAGEDYPEIRFGFEVTIYGPDRSFGRDMASTWTPAYCTWGSFSGNRSIQTNKETLRLYTYAIELAETINAIVGLD